MPARRTARKPAHTGPARASIYVRMSLDKSGEGLGVERQEQQCRELCEDNGWEVAEVYRDNDISATTGKRRPGFEALLASNPEVVVTWHTDRLVRLSRELERVIDLDVNVYTVASGGMDLSNPAGRAVAKTVTAWAQYEGEQKGLRQRASARQRAEAGKSWWPTRPFGFELDGTHRAEEAAALVKAYGDLLTGASLRTIARELADAGHLTNAGNPWTATTFRLVLLNARNAGIRMYDGEEVGAAAWAGIVSEDVWRAAVRLLTNPARRTGGGGGGAPRNLLTGVATCGKCGSTVKVGWRGGRAGEPGAYSVYVCRASSCVSVPVVAVDAAVSVRLARELDSPKTRDQWQGLRRREGESVQALRVDEAAVRSRLDGLAEDYADGIMDRVQFQIASTKLRARLAEVGESIEQAARSADVADTVTHGDRVMETFLAQDPSTPADDRPTIGAEEFRKLVSAVFERVELMPRGRGVRTIGYNDFRFTARSASPSMPT